MKSKQIISMNKADLLIIPHFKKSDLASKVAEIAGENGEYVSDMTVRDLVRLTWRAQEELNNKNTVRKHSNVSCTCPVSLKN